MQTRRERKNLRISAVIPAYNEAKNILQVLLTIKRTSSISEIVVVSDGSTDDTVALGKSVAGVRVIALPRNVGKTWAAIRGVQEAENPVIMFFDADLINLKQKHISDLIDRYCEGYDMVIMDKGSQPWIFRSLLKSAPAVSGTRILDKRHFRQIPFLEKDRFQFEIRINDFFLSEGLSIAISPAREVHDVRKFVKYPFIAGLFLDIKGGLEVIASDGPRSVIKNLAVFWKIKNLA